MTFNLGSLLAWLLLSQSEQRRPDTRDLWSNTKDYWSMALHTEPPASGKPRRSKEDHCLESRAIIAHRWVT